MMWSAICRGAGVGPDARIGSRASRPSAYAGDASDISVRSTSDRRTRHSRPTRTARSRPVLIQMRTVAGWIFSSALTCGTVSHGSSPAIGVLEIASGIECGDGLRREIYQLGKSEHRRAHNGGILRRGTAASQMDDQSGKVIDGTARARHWRRSRTETRGEDRETEVRSDAPKGFAASLLVPANMLDGVPPDIADVSTAATGSAQHGTSEEDGHRAEDASAAAPDHRNPFLMPEAEAAVIRAPAKRRFGRLTTRAVITRRIAWPAFLTRPLAGRPRATRRGLLAVVAVSAGAAVITDIAVHAGAPSRSEPTQSTKSAAAIASLDRLGGASLQIRLRPAQRSRNRASKGHTNRVHRPPSHQTLVSRVTAVAARYTTPPTRTSGTTSTSAPAVQAGSTTSSGASSGPGSTASSTPTESSSRPTASHHATTQAFGAGGALGPGSSPDG